MARLFRVLNGQARLQITLDELSRGIAGKGGVQ